MVLTAVMVRNRSAARGLIMVRRGGRCAEMAIRTAVRDRIPDRRKPALRRTRRTKGTGRNAVRTMDRDIRRRIARTGCRIWGRKGMPALPAMRNGRILSPAMLLSNRETVIVRRHRTAF